MQFFHEQARNMRGWEAVKGFVVGTATGMQQASGNPYTQAVGLGLKCYAFFSFWQKMGRGQGLEYSAGLLVGAGLGYYLGAGLSSTAGSDKSTMAFKPKF